jgi:hypothetical protein
MGRAEDWVLIEKELRSAWSLLPVGLVESAEGYCEADFLQYLNNNEYLLAMEELDGVIEDNTSPSRQFWVHLISADELMDNRHPERYKAILRAITDQ